MAQEEVRQARTALLQLQLARADSLLSFETDSKEVEALVAYHQAYIPFLSVLLSDGPDGSDAFFERSDAARRLLDDTPNTSWFRWISAEVEIQRTLVWAKKGEYLRAALAANAAWQLLNDLLEDDPSFAEAQKGIGLLHLALGTLPRRFRRLLGFFGYKGSLEQGLAELKTASTTSTYGAEEALIVLATVDKFGFPSTVVATDVYQDLWQELEGSPLIGLLFADALIRDRRPEAAIEIVVASRTFAEESGAEYVGYLDYYEGEALFRLNRCEESAGTLERYVEQHQGPSLKLAAIVMIAQCHEIMGDRVGATSWYAMVTDSRGFAEEGAAVRLAARRAEHPMTQTEAELLKASNLFNSRNDVQADSLFRAVLGSGESDATLLAEAKYGLGRIDHESGNLEQALSAYSLVLDSGADPQSKWIPFSMMHSAHINASLGNVARAEELVDAIDDIRADYDFKSAVENRARLIKESLF